MEIWPPGFVFVAILTQFARYHVTCTHFRGVHMWWDTVDGNREVSLSYRVAWKRDWREETNCDHTTIASGTLIGPPGGGYMKCVGCEEYDVTIGNMLFRCTDYSDAEDWTAGVGNNSYTFPTSTNFIVKWAGQGWLDGVHAGHDRPWSARMTVDLAPRPDTRLSNSSPRSAVPPVLRLQYGCQYNIHLPVTDPDGDVVRCRWATRTVELDECGGICGAFDGADLNQDNCTLRYVANQQVGYFAAAIQLEDYIRDSAPYINPLSSVPLQFLVMVYEAPEGIPCDAKPELIAPTPMAGSCVILAPNDVYSVMIVARVKDDIIGLRDIETVSLLGMNKSEVMYYQESRQEFYVDVTWIPSTSQLGQQVFCFTAIDGRGTASERRCLYLLVTQDAAPEVSGFAYNISSREVSITFNVPIKRPSEKRYIYVYSTSSNTAIMTLDTSNPDVTHVSDSTLSFLLSEDDVSVQRIMYVMLDEGAVQNTPNSRCGRDSLEMKDASSIVFDTLDGAVTPAASRKEKDYTWLIVVVVIIVVLAAIIVMVATLVVKKRNSQDKYSREERQEQYTRNVAHKMAVNGAYEPDFNDIDVKFR